MKFRSFHPSRTPLYSALSALLAFGAMPVAPALAQDGAESLEEVVVTGTRREARSVHDSPAPIDVIGGDDFRNQGNADMVELVRTVVPSFNVNTQPVSDASTVIRPINLRGLAPDHTLLLLNGKRRHRAAAIGWLTNGVSDGAQGPDLSVIPAIALKQVEVLRDGASAQYGSDAIAGVMNVILKDDSEGGTVEFKYGEYKASRDGSPASRAGGATRARVGNYTRGSENDYLIAGNFGIPITSDGFFNFSFEYSETDETFRAVQRSDAQALIDAGNDAVPVPAQNWGNPRVDPNIKTFFNFGLDFNEQAGVYAFGNYAFKEGEGSFYFRNPNTRAAIFSNDGGATRLVGNVPDDNGVDCPHTETATRENAEGKTETYLVNPVPATLAGGELAAIIANPNCFVFNEAFPGGFTPRFGAEVIDASLVAGVRGEAAGVRYDVSGGVGHSDADFFIFNTVNGSLGPDSPTSFDPGDYTQTEYNFNVDVSYPLDVPGLASPLNIAGGYEYRIEEFELTAGDVASYIEGPYAEQGFSVGSNGFPGFPASIAGNWDRDNHAVYLDVEADITSIWLVGLAARFEDFETFGDTLNGKLATHLRLTDWLALRGTWSTGFRAPTPGQQNAANTTSAFDAEAGDIIHRGTIPSTSPFAALRGGTILKEEVSENITAGAVLDWGALSISIDYYNIQLDDRIALTETFQLTDEERTALIADGVPMARDLEDFRFFQNAFDTETEGLDIVATLGWEWLGGGSDLSIAWNSNESKVKDYNPAVINDQRIREVEEGLPELRYNATFTHQAGDFRLLLRYNHADDWYDEEDGQATEAFDGRYPDYYTLDLELAYNLSENLNLTVGGQNFTDEYPEKHPHAATTLGNQYSQFAPLGFNGAFYYGRLRYEF